MVHVQARSIGRKKWRTTRTNRQKKTYVYDQLDTVENVVHHTLLTDKNDVNEQIGTGMAKK